jgi:hypothetical protein
MLLREEASVWVALVQNEEGSRSGTVISNTT